jgi:hypothetical protein
MKTAKRNAGKTPLTGEARHRNSDNKITDRAHDERSENRCDPSTSKHVQGNGYGEQDN